MDAMCYFEESPYVRTPFAPNEPRYYGPPTITISGPDGVYSTYNLQRQIGPRNRSNSNGSGATTSAGSSRSTYLSLVAISCTAT
jgi:hypothetical protein